MLKRQSRKRKNIPPRPRARDDPSEDSLGLQTGSSSDNWEAPALTLETLELTSDTDAVHGSPSKTCGRWKTQIGPFVSSEPPALCAERNLEKLPLLHQRSMPLPLNHVVSKLVLMCLLGSAAPGKGVCACGGGCGEGPQSKETLDWRPEPRRDASEPQFSHTWNEDRL